MSEIDEGEGLSDDLGNEPEDVLEDAPDAPDDELGDEAPDGMEDSPEEGDDAEIEALLKSRRPAGGLRDDASSEEEKPGKSPKEILAEEETRLSAEAKKYRDGATLIYDYLAGRAQIKDVPRLADVPEEELAAHRAKWIELAGDYAHKRRQVEDMIERKRSEFAPKIEEHERRETERGRIAALKQVNDQVKAFVDEDFLKQWPQLRSRRAEIVLNIQDGLISGKLNNKLDERGILRLALGKDGSGSGGKAPAKKEPPARRPQAKLPLDDFGGDSPSRRGVQDDGGGKPAAKSPWAALGISDATGAKLVARAVQTFGGRPSDYDPEDLANTFGVKIKRSR